MNNLNFENKLNNEILRRINSNNWNLEIASRVISSRQKKRKRITYFSYISSFSLAAFAAVFYFLGTGNEKKENLYQKFITKQVEGTYHYIKNNKSLTSITVNDLAEPSGNEIDYFVDEVLSSR
jgi:hypothetical protein